MRPMQIEFSTEGTKYLVNANQFFFQKEHKNNHTCRGYESSLWAPANTGKKSPMSKNWRIGQYS